SAPASPAPAARAHGLASRSGPRDPWLGRARRSTGSSTFPRARSGSSGLRPFPAPVTRRVTDQFTLRVRTVKGGLLSIEHYFETTCRQHDKQLHKNTTS